MSFYCGAHRPFATDLVKNVACKVLARTFHCLASDSSAWHSLLLRQSTDIFIKVPPSPFPALSRYLKATHAAICDNFTLTVYFIFTRFGIHKVFYNSLKDLLQLRNQQTHIIKQSEIVRSSNITKQC